MRLAPWLLVFASSGAGAHCYEQAAERYQLSADLLRAVATVESGGDPKAMNLSHLQRTGSYDVGLMQINSRWLPTLAQHGITEAQLRSDPCLNAQVGAWILSDTLRRHGNDWNGVGAYNAACTQLKGRECSDARNRYAWRVYRAMTRSAPQPASRPASAPAVRIAVLSLPTSTPSATSSTTEVD